MKVVLFCHSLASDWNNGNAHFLRGVVRELIGLGHAVDVWEPRGGWSREHLRLEHGERPLEEFRQAYPGLASRLYDPGGPDLAATLDGADLVLVHEWNDPGLVRSIGAHRRAGGHYALLFHDTHHRAVSAPAEMARYELSGYDGVLAFGSALADVYRARGWARRVWTWHEAADHRLFRPLSSDRERADLVWIGNWGDGERAEELREFLVGPVRRLRLDATIHGVRYPTSVRDELAAAGIRYRGWTSNLQVPRIFARHSVTVHVPRRPYVEQLPGIPTIRVFEALACGIPLVCSPWEDREGLFRDGDYLCARNGAEMLEALSAVLKRRAWARRMAERGRRRVLERHTCLHRAHELLAICAELGVAGAAPAQAAAEGPRRRPLPWGAPSSAEGGLAPLSSGGATRAPDPSAA